MVYSQIGLLNLIDLIEIGVGLMGKFGMVVETKAGNRAQMQIITRDGCCFMFDADSETLSGMLFDLVKQIGSRPQEHRALGEVVGKKE